MGITKQVYFGKDGKLNPSISTTNHDFLRSRVITHEKKDFVEGFSAGDVSVTDQNLASKAITSMIAKKSLSRLNLAKSSEIVMLIYLASYQVFPYDSSARRGTVISTAASITSLTSFWIAGISSSGTSRTISSCT